jgi:hypothetical protein
MNVQTATPPETSSPETLDRMHHGDHTPQWKPIDPDHGRRAADGRRPWSWVAVIAVLACVALAIAAVAVSLDDSSDADAVPTVFDVEGDRDFHREPSQAATSEPLNLDGDRDFHREPSQAATSEPLNLDGDRDFHREPAAG